MTLYVKRAKDGLPEAVADTLDELEIMTKINRRTLQQNFAHKRPGFEKIDVGECEEEFGWISADEDVPVAREVYAMTADGIATSAVYEAGTWRTAKTRHVIKNVRAWRTK